MALIFWLKFGQKVTLKMAAVVLTPVSPGAGPGGVPQFVGTQAETTVRHIAGSSPYGARREDVLSLRENAEEITTRLSAEIAARVTAAGVVVVESWIMDHGSWITGAWDLGPVRQNLRGKTGL